jgi:hypothetical protein
MSEWHVTEEMGLWYISKDPESSFGAFPTFREAKAEVIRSQKEAIQAARHHLKHYLRPLKKAEVN